MQPFEPGSPSLDAPARGRNFLALLGDAGNVEIMRAVRADVLARDELISRLGYEGSSFDRRIRRLKERGLVLATEVADDRRRKAYRLARCGCDLLAVDAAVDRALDGFAVQLAGAKALLMKSVSDPWDRTVLRVSLSSPQRFNDLLRLARSTAPAHAAQVAGLTVAGLKLRLARLQRLGLVVRGSASDLYQPGPNLWLLGRPAASMARWRWRWTPASVPRVAGDLAGLVRMIGGRARVPRALEVRIVMHVIPPPGMEAWPDVVVCLTDGRMTIPELTLEAPDAHMRATAPGWLDSLLDGAHDAIEVEGDPSAAQAVCRGLLDALGP